MAGKYLRHLQFDFVHGNRWTAAQPDRETLQLVYREPQPCLDWMYEYLCLPIPTDGIGKILVNFTSSESGADIEVVPLTPEDRPGQGMAMIFELFARQEFAALSHSAQRVFLLDHLHRALIVCCENFGWERQPFDAARQKIIDSDFVIVVPPAKPVSSPDRQLKAGIQLEVSSTAEYSAVFADKRAQVTKTVLFSRAIASGSSGTPALYQLRWIDPSQVEIKIKGMDYFWTCHLDGTLNFHSPRAEAGDPHGEYQLGKLYLEGQYVLRDEAEGWKWIQSASAKGYGHAKKLMERRDRPAGN